MKKFLWLALISSLSLTTAHAQDGAKTETVQTETVKTETPKPDKVAQDTYDVLMGGIQDNSYAAFVSVVDEDFRLALKPALFQNVVEQFAPRFKAGMESTYLCTLTQRGSNVSLWKLTFKDKGDDILATLSMKDGKANGFFLR